MHHPFKDVNGNIHFFGGTGSYPPLHSGWHLKIRHKAKKQPLKLPCIRIASIAYSEQVGVNRQQGILAGEMFFL